MKDKLQSIGFNGNVTQILVMYHLAIHQGGWMLSKGLALAILLSLFFEWIEGRRSGG